MDARPQVIAHRGASAAAPGNTVEAFRLAVALGADAIELDVRRSADGHLVVHHDPRLAAAARPAGGAATGAAIVDLPRAALPAHVPDLAAALDACAGAWVNVEVKNDPSEPDFRADRSTVHQVLDELHARFDDPGRWLISSFDRGTIDAVRASGSPIRTALLVYAVTDAAVAATAAGGHHALHPWVHELDADGVHAAHAAGLVVNAWTCNDEHRLRALVDWGVDGVCTDVPDVARRVVDGPG